MSEMSWRAEIDSLAFQPPGHEAHCFIHRRAFVTLCGANTVEDCERYYGSNRAAILHAAAKVQRLADLVHERDRAANPSGRVSSMDIH